MTKGEFLTLHPQTMARKMAKRAKAEAKRAAPGYTRSCVNHRSPIIFSVYYDDDSTPEFRGSRGECESYIGGQGDSILWMIVRG